MWPISSSTLQFRLILILILHFQIGVPLWSPLHILGIVEGVVFGWEVVVLEGRNACCLIRVRQIARIWLRLRKDVLALMRRGGIAVVMLMERFKKFGGQFGVLVLARGRGFGGICERLWMNMMWGVPVRGGLKKQVGLVQLLGLIWGVRNVAWVV